MGLQDWQLSLVDIIFINCAHDSGGSLSRLNPMTMTIFLNPIRKMESIGNIVDSDADTADSDADNVAVLSECPGTISQPLQRSRTQGRRDSLHDMMSEALLFL